MRKVCYRVVLCFTAVSCFWLGAVSSGNGVPLPAGAVSGLRTAVEQAMEPDRAEQYLTEKLPVLLTEVQKIFHAIENGLFFGQYL